MRSSAGTLALVLVLVSAPPTARAMGSPVELPIDIDFASGPLDDAYAIVGSLFCDGDPNPDGGPCTIWSDTCTEVLPSCEWHCSPDPRGTCDAPPMPYLGDYEVVVCEAQFPDCPMNYVVWALGQLPDQWRLPACDPRTHPLCLVPVQLPIQPSIQPRLP